MKTRRLRERDVRELREIIKNNERTGAEMKRAQAVLLLDQEKEIEEIEDITGYGRSQIFELRKQYLESGISSIEDKRKGKPKELLTKKQREEVIETVKTKKPSDLGTYYEKYDHWTTSLLGDWIKREYEVLYRSKTSFYLIFKQSKFTYHKPGRVYDKHNEEEVVKWRKSTKPKLKKLLKDENTVVLAADEMILTTATTIQKAWLPEGEYPKIECSTGGRKRRNVYGFLNMKTGTEHAFKTELQNMYVTKEILEKVRARYPQQKIALFWDNAGWHRGSVVRDFIKQDENIEVIHFPPYAPEENPQEHVWKSGRSQVTHNHFIEDIDKATDELVEYFNTTKFSYKLFGFSPSS
jgi:transposase